MYHISNIFSHVQYRGGNRSRDNANPKGALEYQARWKITTQLSSHI